METFKIEFEVRDNEIDIQGVVNNSNYFNYLAHARHQFAKAMGISFSDMAKAQQFLFLIDSHTQFKKSLKPDDKFYVTCKLVPESTHRFAFEQEIRALPDNTLIVTSRNICVCIDGNNRNRPYIPDIMKHHFSC